MQANKTEYPYLMYLLRAYFHQDFYMDGNTLDELIPRWRNELGEEDRIGLVHDIARLVAQHADESDSQFAETFVQVFQPEVIAEGFDGLTTRQWLKRIAALVQA